MKAPDPKLVFVLIAGVLIGWFAAFGTVHCKMRFDGPPQKGKILEHFSRELSLDAVQKEKVGKILEETRAKIDTLRAQARPGFEAIRRDADGRIRELLKAEQLPKFEELRKKMEENRSKKRRRGPE